MLWFDCCKTKISQLFGDEESALQTRIAVPLKALIVIFSGSSTLDTVPQQVQDWHRSCARRCSLAMVQCQQCQAENVIDLFWDSYQHFGVLEHFGTNTTVQSLNSQHLPCCKYSMAPCVASTTPLNKCKHAPKKVMQVNAKQDPGVCISDHLRLKCCLKSKFFTCTVLNQCRVCPQLNCWLRYWAQACGSLADVQVQCLGKLSNSVSQWSN